MSTRSLTISRTELSLGPLQLWDPGNGYFVLDNTFGGGQQTKRRETVQSPWVHGRFATAIVKDVQIAPLAVEVMADSEAVLTTRIQALLAALDQFSFILTAEQHGLGQFSWICESADWSVGPAGVIDDFDLTMAPYGQVVTATIPRSPIPATGIF